MIVRITSKGWETYTGSLGHKAVFKDGVSVEPLNARQIARIGSTMRIVCAETGEQVGPSVVAAAMRSQAMVVTPPALTLVETKAQDLVRKEALAEAEAARVAAEKAALAAAERRRADSDASEIIIYTRAELEAIASNNGINALRDIATPLNVRGRAIAELIGEILKAQTDKALV